MQRLAEHDRTSILIARATVLQAELRAACAESEALIRRSRERLLSSTYPLLRLIHGGSDAALVSSTIANAAFCLHCLATKTGLSIDDVNAQLQVIAKTIRLKIGPHRCDHCRQQKTTFSVTKDGQP